MIEQKTTGPAEASQERDFQQVDNIVADGDNRQSSQRPGCGEPAMLQTETRHCAGGQYSVQQGVQQQQRRARAPAGFILHPTEWLQREISQ
ncbi:hypothetical protein D3C80_2003050 [compost metagenome]